MRYIMIGLVGLFSHSVFANDVMFGSPAYITVSTTSTNALKQNGLRSYLIIMNTGSNTMFARFGNSNQNTSDGVPIPAGGNYEPAKAPSNSVYLISPTGSFATVIEGQ
jgi:hypothetical protein